MPQQTDPAVPTRIASISESLVGQKLRLAGRLLSYDITTGLILLLDGNIAVLVDVSLCADYWSCEWAREHWGTIMTIGYLEDSSEEFPIPTIPAYASAPDINPRLVFRALLVIRAADLDISSWNLAIEEREHSSLTT